MLEKFKSIPGLLMFALIYSFFVCFRPSLIFFFLFAVYVLLLSSLFLQKQKPEKRKTSFQDLVLESNCSRGGCLNYTLFFFF